MAGVSSKMVVPWWLTGTNSQGSWRTLTFGERAENHPGMQKLGTVLDRGISVARLREIKDELHSKNIPCKLKDLSVLIPGAPEAMVLVVRVDDLMQDEKSILADLLAELCRMPIDKMHLDTTYHKKVPTVVNSISRYNCTIGDEDQAPDIANGKGTVNNFKHYKAIAKLRLVLTDLLRVPKLYGEVNDYYDPLMCGINFHGDQERRVVIGGRFGSASDVPLLFQWYKRGVAVGSQGRIPLNSGDLYIMSEKAVGFDCGNWDTLTLKHAAGKDSFFKRIKRGREERPVVTL